MSMLTLSRAEFRDRVYACWLGKNIGGTLGAPFEGERNPRDLDFYRSLPQRMAPNRGLDLQLVWLTLLEDHGVDPSLPLFADYFARHAASYPWDEHGFFLRNYCRGLRPPIAGCFENYFVDEAGSAIRSELWACVHPGDPQSAARMAWKDSALDHGGGEGMYGEMFWAAVESAAFVESDARTLIRVGLNMIPLSCQVSRSIREAVWCFENGASLADARQRIVSRFGQAEFRSAAPNHGLAILGWLYGKDFGDSLCKALSGGHDTAGNCATLGALLGILGGSGGIPERWKSPVGEGIVVHGFTRNFTPPGDIGELADRTAALAELAARECTERVFGPKSQRPADMLSRLFRNLRAREGLAQDIHAGMELSGPMEIVLHYHGEPVLRPGIAREVSVSARDTRPLEEAGLWVIPHADLFVPEGWSCRRIGRDRFEIFCGGAVADRNILTVQLTTGQSADFAILGPGAARGFPAGQTVAICPRCQAREGACVCAGT